MRGQIHDTLTPRYRSISLSITRVTLLNIHAQLIIYIGALAEEFIVPSSSGNTGKITGKIELAFELDSVNPEYR